MEVSLATPEKVFFSGNSSGVVLNAEKGQLTLLNGHANLVTLLKPGMVSIRGDKGDQNFQVGSGVLKVEDNRLTILASRVQL